MTDRLHDVLLRSGQFFMTDSDLFPIKYFLDVSTSGEDVTCSFVWVCELSYLSVSVKAHFWLKMHD